MKSADNSFDKHRFKAAKHCTLRPTENIERATRRLTGETMARDQVIPEMIERIKKLIGGSE